MMNLAGVPATIMLFLTWSIQIERFYKENYKKGVMDAQKLNQHTRISEFVKCLRNMWVYWS